MKRSFFSTDGRYRPYSYKTLTGRYLHLPAKDPAGRRTFVVVYGQHATLERIQPITEALTAFGDVYAVDNPGFGGMAPSYKIGEYPSLKFYAGHLHHFINDYIPAGRQLTILGISFGFQIAAETLHRYPSLQKRTEVLMSFVGFVSFKDFNMSPTYSIPRLYVMANGGRSWLGAQLTKVLLQDAIITNTYRLTKPIQVKFKSLPKAEADQYAREQAWLWRVNDARTHAATGWDFFKHNDLTAYRLPIAMWHMGVPNDHYFDNARISQELQAMFKSVKLFEMQLDNHAPLDIDTPEKVVTLLPDDLRKLLQESANKEAVLS